MRFPCIQNFVTSDLLVKPTSGYLIYHFFFFLVQELSYVILCSYPNKKTFALFNLIKL